MNSACKYLKTKLTNPGVEAEPKMVNVFPVPECPYTEAITFKFSFKSLSLGFKKDSNTDFESFSSSKIWSKMNEYKIRILKYTIVLSFL